MKSFHSRDEIEEFCLSHMLRRLGETVPQTSPYPHFWTTSIFPEEIFDRVLQELPVAEWYSKEKDDSKHYENRISLRLHPEWIDRLPPASQELWHGVRSALNSQELKRAIFSKVAVGLAHRFNVDAGQVADIEGYPSPALYQESAGYEIAPHPDTRRKLVTVQFALAKDDSQSELGTSMYKLSTHPKHLLHKPRGFCEVKRYPFARNSIFAFAVVNTISMRSWHGRERLPETCGLRNSILNIYYAQQQDANPETVPDNPAKKIAA